MPWVPVLDWGFQPHELPEIRHQSLKVKSSKQLSSPSSSFQLLIGFLYENRSLALFVAVLFILSPPGMFVFSEYSKDSRRKVSFIVTVSKNFVMYSTIVVIQHSFLVKRKIVKNCFLNVWLLYSYLIYEIHQILDGVVIMPCALISDGNVFTLRIVLLLPVTTDPLVWSIPLENFKLAHRS